jgi:hypothetical protein
VKTHDEDVLRGTFQQAEFAADLSRVHARNATDEYQDPVLFFQRTFITEGMRLLLDSVVKRLTGRTSPDKSETIKALSPETIGHPSGKIPVVLSTRFLKPFSEQLYSYTAEGFRGAGLQGLGRWRQLCRRSQLV